MKTVILLSLILISFVGCTNAVEPSPAQVDLDSGTYWGGMYFVSFVDPGFIEISTRDRVLERFSYRKVVTAKVTVLVLKSGEEIVLSPYSSTHLYITFPTRLSTWNGQYILIH